MKPKSTCYKADVWIDDAPEAIQCNTIAERLFEVRKREYERLQALEAAIKEWKRVVVLGSNNPEVKLAWRKLEELLEEQI